ncbi:MAG: MBL fold metallo-hydrolase [Candidatus Latescibacterota bacterium]
MSEAVLHPPRVHLGEIEVTCVNGGRFRLDGGSMFGLVPRPLWEVCLAPDAAHRVALACNCLLVRQGRETVLVDTGLGARFSEREQEIYAVDAETDLGASLQAAGVRPEHVTRVVFTHLHFDHFCGALTGTPSDLAPRFPNAVHVVQQQEWEDALAGRSTMRATYRAVEMQALAGMVPLQLVAGDVLLAEGVSTWVTGGHTSGHQGVRVQAGERVLLYPADIVPTRWHVNPYWCTAYDMAPYDTLQRKLEFLPGACQEGWLVAWNHDPQEPWGRILCDGRRYAAGPAGS